MKLYSFRTFLALFAALSFVTYFTLWNHSEHKTIQTLRVKIPKAYDPNFTDAELRDYFKGGGNGMPIADWELRGSTLPNDDTFLTVSLEKNGRLKINQQFEGTLENPAPLLKVLSDCFSLREKLGVYEENTNKVVKAVIVKAPRSEKYGNIVKIVDVVKSSGADPIVLQIDDLPQ